MSMLKATIYLKVFHVTLTWITTTKVNWLFFFRQVTSLKLYYQPKYLKVCVSYKLLENLLESSKQKGRF